MKRKHRHELKQNDFLVWLEQTVSWFSENRRTLMIGGIVAVVAAASLGGVYFFATHRQSEAQNLLNKALELYHGRIRESSVVQSASGTEFANTEERYRESLRAFEEVFEQYSSTKQGRQARYYAALCHTGLGQYDEAEALLEDVTEGRRDLLHYLAASVRAGVKSEQGEYEAAAEIYRILVEDPNNPLAKDLLLFQMAGAEEQAGNLESARKDYQRVLEEYPDSVLRMEVLQRTELLEFRLDS